MYLAKLQLGNSLQYQIRQSYRKDSGEYGYRTLFDLGENPPDFFSIAFDYVVIFRDELLETLKAQLQKDPEAHLEKLLFEFFPQNVQQKLNTFSRKPAEYRGRLTKQEIRAIQDQVHIFDRRRLYYLRYGAVDQSRLTRLHEKCCRPLLSQSRDEREYYFMEEEKVLEPGSYFQYIFAIFNLQKHFKQSFAPWLPEALAREEVEEQFTSAICQLQQDTSFWQSRVSQQFLHTHLARYLWMFFDFVPHQPSFQRDFARAFMGAHRNFKWPERQASASPEKIEEIFGQSAAKLKAMPSEDLTRLYRKKAMELHPDQGGDAEQFIILTEVYTSLLEKKK